MLGKIWRKILGYFNLNNRVSDEQSWQDCMDYNNEVALAEQDEEQRMADMEQHWADQAAFASMGMTETEYWADYYRDHAPYDDNYVPDEDEHDAHYNESLDADWDRFAGEQRGAWPNGL